MQHLQLGGSVFECNDCNIPLHESCAQSTISFLCNFCLRKKRLREHESETDATSDQEESSEGEKEDGIILEIYSASPSSSESQPEEEYTIKERLVTEPFSIGD